MGIAVFFGLYYGICNNMNLSRYVRFNCMQCILLDILLIIPSLLENLVPMPESRLWVSGPRASGGGLPTRGPPSVSPCKCTMHVQYGMSLLSDSNCHTPQSSGWHPDQPRYVRIG